MTIDVKSLAAAYDKPVEYVEALIRAHAIKSLPRYRTPDDGYNAFFSDLTAFYDTTPSMTKQEFTEECDLNVIVRRFIASDFDPSVIPISNRKAQYGDFSELPDSFHAAMNYVKETESMFLQLPADFRAKFDNDPQGFLNFVADPANEAELVRLGFATSRTPEQARLPNSAVASEGSAPAISSASDVGKRLDSFKKAISDAFKEDSKEV